MGVMPIEKSQTRSKCLPKSINMKIGIKFNLLTQQQYIQIIKNRHKYTDFNVLGLYRSIVENEKLDLAAKIAVRDLAHESFFKTFEFFQLKDPYTYLQVSTLGQTLTVADQNQIWKNIRTNQEKILKQKRIKHRNFGEYSKHNCGYENCPYDGIMIHQGSRLAESVMHFDSDRSKWLRKLKVSRQQLEKRKFRDDRLQLLDNLENDLQELI